MNLRSAVTRPLSALSLSVLTLFAGLTIAPAAQAAPAVRAAPASAAVAGGDTSVNGIYTGQAFDTCEAPSTGVMQQWRSSPYGAIGIYIGGVNRTCPQRNLNAGWINAVHAQGWFTLPIYVGLQAPCTDVASRINPRQAGAQGSAAAADAAAKMTALGLAAGNPIYLDIENYNPNVPGCSNAVKGFVSSFVAGAKARGYLAGVYGGANSITSDLVSWRSDRSFRSPDMLWYARWDGRASTSGEKTLPANLWNPHRRVHQYRGNITATYGSATLAIDADAVDSFVTGAKVRLTASSARTRLARAVGVPLVTGGTAPYAVSVTSGSLPAGLRFSSGRLVGTPTRVGVQSVRLRVSDSGSPRRAVTASLTVAVDFTDVPPSQPFHGDILWTAEHGIVTGYADGSFRPQVTVTRQDLAVMIARYSGDPMPACTSAPFKDVSRTSSFCPQIAWVKRMKLVTGFSNGTFGAASRGSRQDLVVILSRFVGGSRPACTRAPFKDVPRTSSFCPQIAWAASKGLVTGFAGGYFRPQQAGSRQDAAVVLHRLNGIRRVG